MDVAISGLGGVAAARNVARVVLAGEPERWQHTAGVARRAEALAGTVPTEDDGEVLITAAWLHDIGYARALRQTGFHPLDGALFLHAAGWPARVVALVAHHSEALCVAEVRGLADRLAWYGKELSPVSDALTCADQTVGPFGRAMDLDQRLADMLRRHGPESPSAVAFPQREPLLRAAVGRVDERLRLASVFGPPQPEYAA